MTPTLIDINLLKENPDNPRTITDAKFAQLIESVKNFPQMLEVRPIAFKSGFVVLGGNMRLRACKAAGLKQVPAVDCSDMTEAQQREFILKDNIGYGSWDWEAIQSDWPEAEDWGLDVPNWSAGMDENNMKDEDVDIMEEFNAIGTMDGKQRVVFLFDGQDEAESYLKSLAVEFKKMNMAWQVDLSTQSI
jgi:hypothetical protein